MRYIHLLIVIVCLQSCAPKVLQIADVDDQNIRIDRGESGVDETAAALIDPFKAKLDLTMNEVIGNNPKELMKGKPNSGLTNWFADALLAETQKHTNYTLDFALQNFGGIRLNSLSAGPITVGKMYELMPFDNVMFVMELDSASVAALCQKFVDSEGYPLSHTLEITHEYGKVIKTMIRNQPLTNRTYYVAIPDYIANGGDNMAMLSGKKFTNTGVFIRDMLIAHVKETKVINVNMNERIR